MYNGMTLNLTKQIRWLVNLNRRVGLIGKVTSYSSFQSGFGLSHVPHRINNSNALLTQTQTSTVQLKFIRLKSKKGKSKGKEVDTDDEFDVDERQDKDEEEIAGAKDIKTSLTSLRVDGVLKAGLGISKAKIENEFYESKIYLNGKKVLKKSHQARVEDEVDLILGHSSLNPEFLQVSRVVIMKVEETESEDTLKTYEGTRIRVESGLLVVQRTYSAGHVKISYGLYVEQGREKSFKGQTEIFE